MLSSQNFPTGIRATNFPYRNLSSQNSPTKNLSSRPLLYRNLSYQTPPAKIWITKLSYRNSVVPKFSLPEFESLSPVWIWATKNFSPSGILAIKNSLPELELDKFLLLEFELSKIPYRKYFHQINKIHQLRNLAWFTNIIILVGESVTVGNAFGARRAWARAHSIFHPTLVKNRWAPQSYTQTLWLQ